MFKNGQGGGAVSATRNERRDVSLLNKNRISVLIYVDVQSRGQHELPQSRHEALQEVQQEALQEVQQEAGVAVLSREKKTKFNRTARNP